MRNLVRWSIVVVLLFGLLPTRTFAAQPRGVYAVYPINDPYDYSPSEVDALLSNPAVSGVALRERWMNLEPSDGAFQFSRIEEVIAKAANAQKTVQLILVPGFFSPSWLLETLTRCEDRWEKTCGKADFSIPYGPDSRGSDTRASLPLPWNPTYKQYWQRLLAEVARRYNTSQTVVSVAIAGPTSVSAEMSLPNDNEADKEKWRRLLQLFYPTGEYQQSNKAIIEEWQKAIVSYDTMFRDKTIILTEGSGLLKFAQGDPLQAKEEIVRSFLETGYNNNSKGMQTSGMKACRNFQAGIGRVKEATHQGVMGGAQFNSSATNNPTSMGCADNAVCGRESKDTCQRNTDHACCLLTPAAAVANVLSVYFDDTAQAAVFGGPAGSATMSYLQVYKDDILYANGHPDVQAVFQKAQTALTGALPVSAGFDMSDPSVSDIDRDGDVDIFDFNLVVTDFGKTGSPADINRNGKVDVVDFTILANHFGWDGQHAQSAVGLGGLYALLEWNGEPDPRTWETPFVDGVVIRAYWKDINPTKGTYRWDYLDRQFQKAAAAGKKVRVAIAPGFYSPPWVLGDPRVTTSSFRVPQGPLKGTMQPLPLPWDETYLAEWFTFIDALAARFRDNPSFSYIGVTGPNSHNGEVSLPREAGEMKTWLALAGGDSSNLRGFLMDAWKKTISRFCAAFSGKKATLALILRSLPLRSPDEEEQYKKELASYGLAACPAVFGLQTNGLDGRPVSIEGEDSLPQWDLVASYAGRVFTGFQTRAPENLYQCKRSGRTCNGTKREILTQTITNGLSRHPDFLEIYESDILDSTVSDILTKAHDSL